MPGVQGLMCTREDEDQSNEKNFKEEVEVFNTFLEIVVALFDLLEYDEKPVYFETENQKSSGQNFLKKATGKEGKIAYEVDTTILSGLETRPGYEMYGANAYFGEDRKLMEIYVSSMGKTIKPEDKEWMHAKWVWRVSLGTLNTAGDHLMKVFEHMTSGLQAKFQFCI